MKTIILACNTIRGEVEEAVAKTGCPHDIIWIESGLHLVPDSLRKRMQEALNEIKEVSRVLLAFGFCGNAVVGLTTGDYKLVIPKVDDCITLLLGSKENRENCTRQGGVYFLTKGWLEGEANIWKEYQTVLDRFGSERTQLIFKKIFAYYKFLGLIDTGAYDLPGLVPHAREIATTLELQLVTIEGTDRYLRHLLSGPWDDESFVVIPPFTTIELSHLGFFADTAPPFIQASM